LKPRRATRSVTRAGLIAVPAAGLPAQEDTCDTAVVDFGFHSG
jgi:hypothetical protein